MNPTVKLDDLLNTVSIIDLDEKLQIEIIGMLFDLSFDENNLDGISHGFELSNQINRNTLKPANLTLLYYDLSNGWSYRRKIKYTNKDESWQFQMEELTNEIVFLRKAIASPGFTSIDQMRQCQILTNLGNSFLFIRRFVEAQDYWKKALTLDKSFAMAIGNMANGLFYYGRVLFDNVHKNLFVAFAYHHLKETLQYHTQIHHDALDGFRSLHDYLKKFITENFPKVYHDTFPNLDYDLGKDEELKKYRLWGLEQGLFINPINDLGAHNTASHDCLNMPTLTLPSNRPPVCLNLYNQVKQ